jgi:hypothetical protein
MFETSLSLLKSRCLNQIGFHFYSKSTGACLFLLSTYRPERELIYSFVLFIIIIPKRERERLQISLRIIHIIPQWHNIKLKEEIQFVLERERNN